MANPDARTPRQPSLHDGINELESLLTDRPERTPGQVPILDELAVPEDAGRNAPADGAPAAIDPRHLAEIARRLEQRLESELADLAGIIRAVVKRCILDELRTHLPPAPLRTQGGAAPTPESSTNASGPHSPD